jgi:hypothetical protein
VLRRGVEEQAMDASLLGGGDAVQDARRRAETVSGDADHARPIAQVNLLRWSRLARAICNHNDAKKSIMKKRAAGDYQA